MLSGKLPTGTVDDRSGGCGVDGRARTVRPGAASGAREGRAETNAAVEHAAAEQRRLERQLATERAERQAVVDRYERLLAERAGRTAGCGGPDGLRERVVMRVRRALSRLRR